MKSVYNLPKKVIYAILAALVALLGILLSLVPSAQKVVADVSITGTNGEYCGIGGAGYLTAYCTGLGYDAGGTCSPGTDGAPCCSSSPSAPSGS